MSETHEPKPKLSNAEIRERRREAALRGAQTRKARLAQAAPEPAAPPARDLLARARAMGREADLFYHAHLARWSHHPSAWTVEQRIALDAFLGRFVRPDGTPQPVRTYGRTRR